MRGATILLLLATAVAADPFAPKREELQLDDAAYARYVETLALLKGALDRDPAGSLERAVALLEPFGLAEQLEDPVATALAGATEEGPRRAALLSLYGHLLVAKGARNGNVWIFGAGGVVQQGGLDDETQKILRTASDMLREAFRLRPTDARAREDLATALDMLDSEKNAAEIARLRMEAGALRLAGQAPAPAPPPDESERLRREAEALEQKQTDPDHAAALLLRKQALVCEFCAYTIPIEYDPALYGPVSLLASEDILVRNLTRTYLKRDKTVDSVPPTYHPAKPAQRAQIAEGLGRDPGPAAGAALLRLLATAMERDAVTEAALRGLVLGKHEAVRRHLPQLLGAAVYSTPSEIEVLAARIRGVRERLRALGVNRRVDGLPEAGFGPLGQALLVEAAGALKVQEAAPVLAALLPLEDDLIQPRGIARALAELGDAAQADALLAVARDPSRDVYFRREAILALGCLAPARLSEVPAEPYLELALAAARYRADPSEALRGRLLQGLGHPHEADDAARYLLELDVREAVPDLERFLADKPDHYAAPVVRDACEKLVSRAKG